VSDSLLRNDFFPYTMFATTQLKRAVFVIGSELPGHLHNHRMRTCAP